MTDDLVKRLREGCSCNFPDTPCGAEEECRATFEAADRIEQLEAALREIMEVSDQKSYGFAFDSHAVYFRMARAALAGEKKDE